MTHSKDILMDTVFSPIESLQELCDFYTVTKCHFKFENLQIFCFVSNELPINGLWDTIPRYYDKDILQSMKE